MPQIFRPSLNTLARASLAAGVLGLSVLSLMAAALNQSPYWTGEHMVRDQPVPFSHKHHVGDLGIDCRFCHGSVQDSSFAGLPPTKTCMTCHSRIWTDAPMLSPIRASYRDDVPVKWTRVHNLPDFVFFSHEIHVNKGVACVTCHGQVDQMPLMWQEKSLEMRWCLQCHDDPGKYLRPRDQVFNMNFTLDRKTMDEFSTPGHLVTDQESLGKVLIDRYHVPTDGRLINCYTCHR
jgi:Zn ribbon nucleic-acid-binding protein